MTKIVLTKWFSTPFSSWFHVSELICVCSSHTLRAKTQIKKKESFCPLWVSILAYISSRLTLGVSYSLREKMIKERGGRRGVGWAGVLCCVCCIWLKFSNCILCISDMTSFIVLQNAYLCEWEFLGSVNISTPKMTLVFVAFSPSSV